ncbi:MAG: signal recognition particle-docking protein FtsY [Chloroflexi bacterium]|nr:signal recognition particle-docking protein FtsY [Chloroflexota bacterium]
MHELSWRKALDRTRRVALGRLSEIFGTSELNAAVWEELEAALVQADLGAALAAEVTAALRKRAGAEGLTRSAELRRSLQDSLLGYLSPSAPKSVETRPLVMVLVGVNGSGKTTSAAKLAARLQMEGRRVLLAAADTYRAAADEQLKQWADRLGIEAVLGRPGSDPGAVAFDAAQAALARNLDVLLVDTSGRMHTSHNLMAELQKVCRATGKVVPGAPHRVLLVLDATTGQNGLAQARAFTQAVGVTEILLTKLDGSAKGGIALAISYQLGLPISYTGLGEGPGDLAPFDPLAYVEALLPSAAGSSPSG